MTRLVSRRFERIIEFPVEVIGRTNVFPDAVSALITIEAHLRRMLEQQSSRLLHAFNLPSGGDVRRVRASLAATEAQLKDIGESTAHEWGVRS